MTTTMFSREDLALIGCWAHTSWRVARSLAAGGEPDRPELEGGSLRSRAAAVFGEDRWYEASRKQLVIYSYDDTSPARRAIVHRVTWRTVAAWLNTWSDNDRDTLVTLDRQRFHLEHSPEELDYNPARTVAESRAIAARRDARMDAGDRDRIRELTDRITALIDQYFTGDRAPAEQQALF